MILLLLRDLSLIDIIIIIATIFSRSILLIILIAYTTTLPLYYYYIAFILYNRITSILIPRLETNISI